MQGGEKLTPSRQEVLGAIARLSYCVGWLSASTDPLTDPKKLEIATQAKGDLNLLYEIAHYEPLVIEWGKGTEP